MTFHRHRIAQFRITYQALEGESMCKREHHGVKLSDVFICHHVQLTDTSLIRPNCEAVKRTCLLIDLYHSIIDISKLPYAMAPYSYN